MTIPLALCLSWLILIFFFLFFGYPSNGRSFLLQTGSLVVGVVVLGTAVYATLYHWPPPTVGSTPANWIFVSWLALSSLSFTLYGYNQRAVKASAATKTTVNGIGEFVLILFSFMGGWAGAFLALFLWQPKNQTLSPLIVTSIAVLGNFVFWAWVGGQV
jgi:uncharacterized membrane protein YsdA (DUF1294 family)